MPLCRFGLVSLKQESPCFSGGECQILNDEEQVVREMSPEEIMEYCDLHGFSLYFFETSFITNDWNWHVQYPSVLHVCARNKTETRSFVLNSYHKSHEYDGDSGVMFRCVNLLYSWRTCCG